MNTLDSFKCHQNMQSATPNKITMHPCPFIMGFSPTPPHSLRASSLGKGRRACNYIAGIWISALKKLMRNADWWKWHYERRHYPWHVFLSICLHLHSFLLHADWRKYDSSVDREPQGNWRWNSNSRDVVASSSSFSSPAARGPVELALRLPSQDQVNLFLAFKK